jgi:hypothetical protein
VHQNIDVLSVDGGIVMFNFLKYTCEKKKRNTIRTCYTYPGRISEGIKASIQKRYSHTHVYCNNIHNSQVME